jgi:hypothetical protein
MLARDLAARCRAVMLNFQLLLLLLHAACQVGVVERPCVGLFGNPELKAFREDGPRQPLYR